MRKPSTTGDCVASGLVLSSPVSNDLPHQLFTVARGGEGPIFGRHRRFTGGSHQFYPRDLYHRMFALPVDFNIVRLLATWLSYQRSLGPPPPPPHIMAIGRKLPSSRRLFITWNSTWSRPFSYFSTGRSCDSSKASSEKPIHRFRCGRILSDLPNI
jgi:hypothetical protein